MSDARTARLELLGETRALVYAFGSSTGLRRNEMEKLRRCDLDLDNGLVTVQAAFAKNRKTQTVPLRRDLAEALRAYLDSFPGSPTDRVFPGGRFPIKDTYKKDLAAAKIPFRDEQGRVMDFHAACRTTTLNTTLAVQGVSQQTRQAIMRHSDPRLTTVTYIDADKLDTRAAVESLPKSACTNLARPTYATTDKQALTCTTGYPNKDENPGDGDDARCCDEGELEMVRPGGFEPTTFGSGGRQLQNRSTVSTKTLSHYAAKCYLSQRLARAPADVSLKSVI
ncbi:tyrosine-type recombinase/integrase [Planctomycetota bacterium]